MRPGGWTRRAMPAAFALWVGAWLVGASLVVACNEGDKKMPPFGSKSTTPWNELQVPGVELFLETEKASPYRSWGAARIDGAGGLLHGKPAFDAVRARAGSDPTTLATLAMLFLDDGVAGRKPWTRPQGGSVPPEEEAIARPPALSGDTLVYWRAHVQLADLVRCQASLASGEVTCELASQLAQAQRVAGDPAGAARDDLASDNVNTRIRGIQALGHVGDDHAREQLVDLALDAHDPRERSAAVEVLGKIGGTGVTAALGRVLLYDRFDQVREAAAAALGELRDPAAREALQRAEAGDADARVQVLAADALKKLK